MPEPSVERLRSALIAVSTVLVVTLGVLAWHLYGESALERRNEDAHPIAEALQGETEEGTGGAWPTMQPPGPLGGGDSGAGADGGQDGGIGDIDAGPPLPAPVEELGYHARQGSRDGIYYLEVIIGDATFDDVLPMVVMIHGRGGSAQIPGGPFLGLSHPVRVIVPQAPDRLGTGWQWLPVYVGQGLVDRLSATLFQTAARLAAMLRGLAEERPTIGRLIVSGFSQGGLLTLTMALHHDDLVGQAFPIASWLPPPIEPVYRRPDLEYPRIRSMHGTADTVIPLQPTAAMFERLAALGFDVELLESEGVTHTISPEQNALFHEWLEAAVCRVVGDEVGAVVAELRALRLRGEELPDAGIPEDVAMFDADLDAGDAPLPDAYEDDAPREPDAFDPPDAYEESDAPDAGDGPGAGRLGD